MRMRLVIFLLTFHLADCLMAQQDYVYLSPVTVYGIPEQKYLAGSKIERLDSSIQNVYNSGHLGEILSFQFPVYFRNYGNGMLSGISFRGTSPQHTAVLWNGININSFSLGQADFSILPAVAFDEIKVHSGGGSSRFGSGAFGGAVLLNTHTEESPSIMVRQEAGSFGRYFSSVKASFNAGRLFSTSSFYHLQSKNNFEILKLGRAQQHAGFSQRGFVQSFKYQFSATRLLQVDYWLHDANREIQPTIGNANTNQGDDQQDRNHRLSVSYQQNNRLGLLKTGGGFVDDEIVFNGSSSHVQRWITFLNHQVRLADGWNFQASVDWNHIVGKIREYGNEPEEDRVDIAFSTQREFKRLILSGNLRKPLVTNMKPPLIPYLGAVFFIVKQSDQQLRLSANASRNFRAPTFNDRYWLDAGNKNLLPEKSYAGEASLSWTLHSLNLSNTFFYQDVNDWILWSPDDNGTFKPANVKKVKSRGIESGGEWKWKTGKFSQQFRISYQFTKSTTAEAVESEAASIGKQLIYTPLHTASGFILSRFDNWSSNLFLQYSGKRFTEASNSALYELDPYLLVDVSIGRLLAKGRHIFNAQFVIKNLFNIEYQQYSAHALPGRSYNFSMRYQLKNKSAKL
jgi:vitamin B12 transporter